MYYTLVIRDKEKSVVMEICTMAIEYEQVQTEVHCLHTSKNSAIEDAKTFVKECPNAKCEVWKMKNVNKGTYSLLDWDKKVWEH